MVKAATPPKGGKKSGGKKSGEGKAAAPNQVFAKLADIGIKIPDGKIGDLSKAAVIKRLESFVESHAAGNVVSVPDELVDFIPAGWSRKKERPASTLDAPPKLKRPIKLRAKFAAKMSGDLDVTGITAKLTGLTPDQAFSIAGCRVQGFIELGDSDQGLLFEGDDQRIVGYFDIGGLGLGHRSEPCSYRVSFAKTNLGFDPAVLCSREGTLVISDITERMTGEEQTMPETHAENKPHPDVEAGRNRPAGTPVLDAAAKAKAAKATNGKADNGKADNGDLGKDDPVRGVAPITVGRKRTCAIELMPKGRGVWLGAAELSIDGGAVERIPFDNKRLGADPKEAMAKAAEMVAERWSEPAPGQNETSADSKRREGAVKDLNGWAAKLRDGKAELSKPHRATEKAGATN